MTTFIYGLTVAKPVRFSRQLVSNTGVLQSPLTGDVQTIARPGERWILSAQWKLKNPERAEVLALLERLNGGEHRIVLPDWQHDRRGVWDGTPVVATEPAVGSNTLAVSGAGLSTTDFAMRGDMFRFDDTPSQWSTRRVLVDADSDGAGLVTLEFLPKIRTPPTVGTGLYFDDTNGAGYGHYVMIGDVEYTHEDVLASGDIVSSFSAQFLDVGA